jgi:hypothetical protein
MKKKKIYAKNLPDNTYILNIKINYKSGHSEVLWTTEVDFLYSRDSFQWKPVLAPFPIKIGIDDIESLWCCEKITLLELKTRLTEEGYEIDDK